MLFLGRRIFAVLLYLSRKRLYLLVLLTLLVVLKNDSCALFGRMYSFSNQKEWKKEMLQPILPLSDFSFALPLAFSSCTVLVPGLV